MHIQIVGFSHTNALRGALKGALPFDYPIDILHMLVEVPGRRFVVDEGGTPQLDPALRAKVQAVGERDKLVFSQVGGNAHHFLGLFRHPQPFDFILPGQPQLALDGAATLLTYAYMAAALRRGVQTDFDLLAALANATSAPICHIESPPPVADSAYCQDHLPPLFQTGAYQGLTVAAPALRYKMWRLHSALIAGECRRLGLGFLPCPPESMDADGFLLPRYYADPLHGNEEYGRLLLRQLAARADARGGLAHG